MNQTDTCRICIDLGEVQNPGNSRPRRRVEAIGTPRTITATINGTLVVTGTMILCDTHQNPDYVTPDMFQTAHLHRTERDPQWT